MTAQHCSLLVKIVWHLKANYSETSVFHFPPINTHAHKAVLRKLILFNFLEQMKFLRDYLSYFEWTDWETKTNYRSISSVQTQCVYCVLSSLFFRAKLDFSVKRSCLNTRSLTNL